MRIETTKKRVNRQRRCISWLGAIVASNCSCRSRHFSFFFIPHRRRRCVHLNNSILCSRKLIMDFSVNLNAVEKKEVQIATKIIFTQNYLDQSQQLKIICVAQSHRTKYGEKRAHNLCQWTLKNQYNGEKWAKKPPMFPIVCVNAERACHRYLCQTAFLQMHRTTGMQHNFQHFHLHTTTHTQKNGIYSFGTSFVFIFPLHVRVHIAPFRSFSLSIFCTVITLFSSFNLLSSRVTLMLFILTNSIAIKLFHPNNFIVFFRCCCCCLCSRLKSALSWWLQFFL